MAPLPLGGAPFKNPQPGGAHLRQHSQHGQARAVERAVEQDHAWGRGEGQGRSTRRSGWDGMRWGGVGGV